MMLLSVMSGSCRFSSKTGDCFQNWTLASQAQWIPPLTMIPFHSQASVSSFKYLTTLLCLFNHVVAERRFIYACAYFITAGGLNFRFLAQVCIFWRIHFQTTTEREKAVDHAMIVKVGPEAEAAIVVMKSLSYK
ncbi:uncharacterized protein LOC129285317 [Prosopis cineraria]|uniref:uncharacterized protein LOC129285317 n=1 Tax=Prosopis cineraria TaxID=364024 RepID=UPI00240F6A4D|nr:uncharacterized protein LOC129285317 [Prosopis cineraria]